MSLWRYGWWLDGSPGGALVPNSSGVLLVAGKYYWEVTVGEGGQDGTSGYGLIMGIAGLSMSLTGPVATAIAINQPNSQYGNFINCRVDVSGLETANGWGYPLRPGGIAAGDAIAVGNVFGFALNTLTKKIWWRNISRDRPTGFWAPTNSGDPVTGAEGADFSSGGASPITTSIAVVVGASHGSGSAKGVGTINFGATAFTGTPPTAYTPINTAFPGAALNPNDNSNIVLSNGNLTFSGANVPVTFSPAIGGFTANVGYSNAVRSRFLIAQ